MASVHFTDRRYTVRDGRKVRTKYEGNKPWQVRWRERPKSPQKSLAFRTRAEAEQFYTKTRAGLLDGSYVAPDAGRELFADVAARWLETVQHLKQNTVAGYESVMGMVQGQEKPRDGSMLARFGDRPVASITTTDVRAFVSELSATKGHSTVRNALNVLRMILATAVDSRLITTNPAAGIKLDRAKAKRDRQARRDDRVYLTAVQVETLADAMPGDYGLLVRFAAYSGMRAGEIAALRVSDVDLDAGRVNVARSVAEVRGQLVEDVPKSGERRSVTLPPFITAAMREYVMATGYRGDDLLFRDGAGGQLRQSNLYRRTFRPTAIRVGMPEGLRFHDLRHTCAALLIEQNAHPKAVSERLGHSSIQITMDDYGHLYESAEDALADALEQVHTAAVG
jgi:integrase